MLGYVTFGKIIIKIKEKFFWDPVTFKKQMKQSTGPVSAFFLIDSLDAIEKCKESLFVLLNRYNAPNFDNSEYFNHVYKIYKEAEKVINYDMNFNLSQDNRVYSALLRLHYIDTGRYEAELWIPGVIANDAKELFGNGHNRFFCAFMPPAFYD